MDGNRRYAKEKGMHPWKGHEEGAKRIEDIIGWCKDYRVEELTLYTFSVQNFQRSEDEKNHLMNIIKAHFEKILKDKRIEEIKVRVIGRTWMFPDDVQGIIRKVTEKTKDHSGFTLNFAMGYGGREEIVDSVKRIAGKVKEGELDIDEIDEAAITSNIYLKSEPDLIIRTGGEHRTSNFLVWQSYYSEWMFVDTYWPAFSKEDFIRCMEEFSKRKRRFGK